MITYLVLAGVSGLGKTTLRDNLIKLYPDYYQKAIQITTRKRRKNESYDSYIWLDEEQYKTIESTLIGCTYFNGNYYGTIPTYENKKTSVIILNKEGLKDFLVKIKRLSDIYYFILGIDKPDEFLEMREGRTIEFLAKEREVLSLCDHVIKLKSNKYIINEDLHEITKFNFSKYFKIRKE